MIEKYMKNALECDVPERVWEKIKDTPITVKDTSVKRKNYKRYAFAFAASCIVVIISVILIKGGIFHLLPNLTENPMSDPTSSESQTLVTSPPKEPTTSYPIKEPTNSESQPNDKLKDMIKIWDYRLYKIQDMSLTEKDLDQQYDKEINGSIDTVFSIKGSSLTESLAVKKQSVIYRFVSVSDGIFKVNNKNYGLTELNSLDKPTEKGKLLRETDNGIQIYEVVGTDKLILVDMTKIIGISDFEWVFIAEMIN